MGRGRDRLRNRKSNGTSNRKRVVAALILSLSLVSFASGQQMGSGQAGAGGSLQLNSSSTRMNAEESGSDTPILSGQAAVAYATEDYPVTPGDVYRLTYFRSLTPTIQSLVVENNMQINLGILGSFNAAGLTFDEAKNEIMAIVTGSYSDSSPQVTILSLGTFPVLVKGEVKSAGFVNVNGLSRLSSVVNSRSTSYASTRRVKVQGRKGESAYYDLFQASRNADMSQNPYLRPGDTVELRRAERQVSVQGEVYRSGSYQLLPGEQLTELVERYGDGLTATALPERLQIVRRGESPQDEPQTIYIDLSDAQEVEAAELLPGDTVRVPSKMQYRPVVYFEGALAPEQDEAEDNSTDESEKREQEYVRIRYSFEQGEKLSNAAASLQNRFIQKSDLANAYILNKGQDEGQRTDVDLDALLYSREAVDPVLQPGDRIIIPFYELEVLLKGEVKRSGYVNVGGRSRLSDIVAAQGTDYSSTRAVKVTDEFGNSKEYDLFQASRNGDMSQNPYLRPGDTVELRRAERQVSVQGQVYRSGSYQLLPGEQLTELVERYGDGLTATALPTEVRITRTGDNPQDETSSLYVDLTETEQRENISLSDGDQVVIPSKMQYRPVVYFEGALVSDAENQARGSEAEAGASSTGKTSRYTRIKYSFEPGERLSTALKAMQSRYRLESDLQGAFLVRADYSETMAVDIESYLLRPQAKDPKLQHGDKIVIPFKQLFVVVSGGVKNPGIYNYVQGRSYEYYVSLAGGIDKSQHWFGEHPKITDDEGNHLPNTAIIEPEYRIHYSHNNPFRVISPIAAVLSTTVSTILVIQNLIQ